MNEFKGWGSVAVCALAGAALLTGCNSPSGEGLGSERAHLTLTTSASLSENFDGIGTSSTATLPSGWRVDKQASPRVVGTYAAASSTTITRSGASMSPSVTNSIYNFGAGVASSSSGSYWLNSADRAVGWLGTGAQVGSGGTKSGNLYVQLQTSPDQDLMGLDISYDVEKYRSGSTAPGFAIQLFWSTDGATWTNAGTQFHTAFNATTDANGFDPAPGATVSVPTTRLTQSVPKGSSIYLAWNYTVNSATSQDFTSAQGLAIDNVHIAGVAPLVVWSTAAGFSMPSIILPSTPALLDAPDSEASSLNGVKVLGCATDSGAGGSGTGGQAGVCDISTTLPDRQGAVRDAILYYLRRGIKEMTGHAPPIEYAADPSSAPGIVFALRSAVPSELANDPAVVAALASNTPYGVDNFEAFYVRTTPSQLLVLANHPEGWVVAVPQILESVGYETLGYGPDWTKIPDKSTGLSFNIQHVGRPGMFYRYLNPAGSSGTGTAWQTQPGAPALESLQPGDEFLQTTTARFRVGTRSRTASVPRFGGDSGTTFPLAMVAAIRADTALADHAFLNNKTWTGALAGGLTENPKFPGGTYQRFDVWVDTRAGGLGWYAENGDSGLVWRKLSSQVSPDISTGWVRNKLFDLMTTWSETEPGSAHRGFQNFPSTPYLFNGQPADGGTWGRFCPHDNDWYKNDAAWTAYNPSSYALNGYHDALGRTSAVLDHSASRFSPCVDPTHPGQQVPSNPSDHVFALANWLLRRYDALANVTDTKRQLIRVSVESYNQNDLLPGFNLDPRISVSVAGFAKHRGIGDWSVFPTHESISRALSVLLPTQPIQDYELVSEASSGGDKTMAGALNSSRSNPMYWAKKLRDGYGSGVRAFLAESDYNGGKLGLAYYLLMKVAYNPALTDADLLSLKDHWLQSAFGSSAMSSYYDLAISGTQPVAGPNQWHDAMADIDIGAQAIATGDTASQRRMNDLKQHWLHYYLVDTGYADQTLAQQIFWKGQMGYTISARVDLFAVAGTSDLNLFHHGTYGSTNPLHFTSGETAGWWPTVREHWPHVDVTMFGDTLLFGSTTEYGSNVDLNDLVAVNELTNVPNDPSDSHDPQYPEVPKPHVFNGGTQKPTPSVLTLATSADVANGTTIGCKVYWHDTNGIAPPDVAWGATYYHLNPDADPNSNQRGDWEPIRQFDDALAPVTYNSTSQDWVVEFPIIPTLPGVYQIQIGATGSGSNLVDFDWNIDMHQPGPTTHALTFNYPAPGGGGSQPSYFYFPKQTGATVFAQFEKLILHGAAQDMHVLGANWSFVCPTDTVGSCRGPQSVPITCADGQRCNTIVGKDRVGQLTHYPIPYFYNVPTLWAKARKQLLVPRKIAQRDGLTILPP